MMSELKRGRSGQAFGVPERDCAHGFALQNAFMVNSWFTSGRSRLVSALSAGSALMAFASPAHAAGRYFATTEIVTGSMLLGVMSAATVSALWMGRQRAKMAAESRALKASLSDAKHNVSRLQALIGDKDRRIVVWDGRSGKPEFLGQLPPETGAPQADNEFLAFGRWLKPTSAGEIERAVNCAPRPRASTSSSKPAVMKSWRPRAACPADRPSCASWRSTTCAPKPPS